MASGLERKSGETHLAMFLNFAGDKVLKLYNTFTYDNPGKEKTLDCDRHFDRIAPLDGTSCMNDTSSGG